MTAIPPRPEEPLSGPRVLTRDPVRVVWVCYGLVQAVLMVLIATEVVNPKWAAIITGIALACYVAVSELYVKKETVPLYEVQKIIKANGNGHAKEPG
jgi:hypothetical protein